MAGNLPIEEVLPHLLNLRDQVDVAARGLTVIHEDRLQCKRGCHECCVDDLSVYEVEAEEIRRHHRELLEHGVPHSGGGCAFLDDEGACRIYEHRPYVCRTQGLPLRWMEVDEGGAQTEYRDICHLNEEGEPIESLEPSRCWSIGPVEERLALLQGKLDGGVFRRVSLRELFSHSAVEEEPRDSE